MAASLSKDMLRVVGCSHALRVPSLLLFSTRSLSDRRKDGPPPWAARTVPSGASFYAINLAKMQNRDVWRKRMDKVNQSWKQALIDCNQRKNATANTPPPLPSMLLMARRVKTTAGRPYWEKDIITQLGMVELNKPVILKNKENISHLLKKVKHLINIVPVTFPYGPPETVDDYEHCYIRDNGELVVTRKLQATEGSETLALTESKVDNKFELKQELIDKVVERKKVLYQIHQEYYPTQYRYKKNEDGKEFRYKGDKEIGSNKIWH